MAKPDWQGWTRVAATLLAVLLAACGGTVHKARPAAPLQPPTGVRGQAVIPERPAPDFTLTDQQGHPFRLQAQKGRVVVLVAGYTHCPDLCPITVSLMAQAGKRLGDDRARVSFVFITTDPARDTPERLQEYLGGFDFGPGAAVYGLTGQEKDLAPVWTAYDTGVEHQPPKNGHYEIQHSTRVWLADGSGQLRLYHQPGFDADALTSDIRYLLHS